MKKVEWLLLHMHLLWSGGGIVLLSALSWLKVGSIQKELGLDHAIGTVRTTSWAGTTRRKISGQRARLFRIALLTSVCLLISLVITIVTGGLLKDWRRSSDVWMECTLYGRPNSRRWDAYDLKEGDVVCRNPTWTYEEDACTSSECMYTAVGVSADTPQLKLSCGNGVRCDCSCDDLVKIERPSVPIMSLGYFARSMVVVIVGINMGLRFWSRTPPFFSHVTRILPT